MNRSARGASPLVCIHGFSGSWRNWVPITPMLERHHSVHVARLAGHARGPVLRPGIDVTVAALADQLERDLDRSGIDRAHLVGNSLGGWLALELAARGRALSVVALSPALGWEPRGSHLRSLAFKLTAGRTLCVAVAPYAELVMSSPRVRRVLLGVAMAHGERVAVVEAAAFVRDNLRCKVFHELKDSLQTTDHKLAAIDCPVQIAWAEHDALIPRRPYGARFPALVPHAQFSTLAGVGHVPMYDDPALVAHTVTDFTTAVDAGQRTPSIVPLAASRAKART